MNCTFRECLAGEIYIFNYGVAISPCDELPSFTVEVLISANVTVFLLLHQWLLVWRPDQQQVIGKANSRVCLELTWKSISFKFCANLSGNEWDSAASILFGESIFWCSCNRTPTEQADLCINHEPWAFYSSTHSHYCGKWEEWACVFRHTTALSIFHLSLCHCSVGINTGLVIYFPILLTYWTALLCLRLQCWEKCFTKSIITTVEISHI